MGITSTHTHTVCHRVTNTRKRWWQQQQQLADKRHTETRLDKENWQLTSTTCSLHDAGRIQLTAELSRAPAQLSSAATIAHTQAVPFELWFVYKVNISPISLYENLHGRWRGMNYCILPTVKNVCAYAKRGGVWNFLLFHSIPYHSNCNTSCTARLGSACLQSNQIHFTSLPGLGSL